jgi:hypothetical protein
MICLPNGTSIGGGATTASTVVATIQGMELDTSTPPNGTPIDSQGYVAVQASAASLYSPSGVKSALISKIILYNSSSSLNQTVNIYVGGVAASNQIHACSIPPLGAASYEDSNGWTVYTSNGVASSAAGLTNVSSYISSTVAIAATTFVNITNVSLSAGTWLIMGTCYSKLTTATLGHMDVFLGPNSASKTGAYVAGSASMGDIAGGTEDDTVTIATVQTFTGTTTVYLEAYASEATTAQNISVEQSIANATGILAIKIG